MNWPSMHGKRVRVEESQHLLVGATWTKSEQSKHHNTKTEAAEASSFMSYYHANGVLTIAEKL